jgi:peptide-methionine (S)-S-oxide reductase
MTYQDIKDPLFAQAVEAIDTGNLALLKELISDNPSLITERLDIPTGDYFDRPYLTWFIADNPIRNGKLPDNIIAVTAILAEAVKQYAPETASQQLNYALELVATGRIPRESRLQLGIMDVLIDAGAKPGDGVAALANGNSMAALNLIKRGGELTLTAAAGFNWPDHIEKLLPSASHPKRVIALAMAAFKGQTRPIRLLLKAGTNPNGYPEKDSGFHTHATPLHQAVSSGSFTCVKLLVEAGAKTGAKDTIYHGTPLDWAEYLQRDTDDERMREKYKMIEDYLKPLSTPV